MHKKYVYFFLCFAVAQTSLPMQQLASPALTQASAAIATIAPQLTTALRRSATNSSKPEATASNNKLLDAFIYNRNKGTRSADQMFNRGQEEYFIYSQQSLEEPREQARSTIEFYFIRVLSFFTAYTLTSMAIKPLIPLVKKSRER
jgi:hypothetical protein